MLRVAGYGLRVTGYEIRVTRYVLRVSSCESKDVSVKPLDAEMARLIENEISVSGLAAQILKPETHTPYRVSRNAHPEPRNP